MSNSSVSNLNSRAQLLLKSLVDMYINNGQPVGSKTLAETAGLEISSATIRNVMCQLDKMGLVEAPHKSAGRIPTGQGYRLFIDTLMETQPITSDILNILSEEINANQSSDRLIDHASNLLSEVTSMAGIVTMPKRSHLNLRQIEFLPLTGHRILVILVINEKEVENRVIHTDRDYSPSELQQVANLINREYAGLDIFDIRKSIFDDLKQARSDIDALMRTAVDIADKAFDVKGKPSDYIIHGKTNLINYSELDDSNKLQQMFQAFNRTRDMLGLFDSCINAEGVKVYVGKESGINELEECSLITAPYKAGNEVLGVLGIIGPTRMNYRNVIPVVQVTANLLGKALKNEN